MLIRKEKGTRPIFKAAGHEVAWPMVPAMFSKLKVVVAFPPPKQLLVFFRESPMDGAKS
jgi:hypothetical protein